MSTKTETTLQQRRAADALKKIENLSKQNVDNYVSYVSALPATIVTNGLGMALVTTLARDKNSNSNGPHSELYKHLASWLCVQITPLNEATGGRPERLIEALMSQDEAVYIQAQAEAIAYLNWLKQFARALLKESADSKG